MISLIKKFSFVKHILFCALVFHLFIPVIAMQEYSDEVQSDKGKCSLLLYPAPTKYLTVDLKQQDGAFCVPFDHKQPYKINYQFDGTSVAQLFTNGQDIFFESLSPEKHNFTFTNPLKAGMLALNTQGKFIFEQPVDVEAARINCEIVELQNRTEFSSAKECLLGAQYVNNNGHLKCADLLFKGDRLNCMPGSSVTVNGSTFVAAVKGFFNAGKFFCAKEMAVETDSFKNVGSLETEGLNCTGDKVVNTGLITIKDYFCGDCKTFDNQSKWNVQKNFLLKSKEFFSTRGSRLYVGGDLKVAAGNIYLSGCTSVDNLALLNASDHATLSAPFYARILYLDSKDFITCHPHAEFVIEHHLGLKAKGFISYAGSIFEKSINRAAASSGKKIDPLLEMFPHGVFLYSEKGSLKKSGAIIAKDGTVCLGAKGRLTHTGLTDAGFYKDSRLLMNAEDLIFEKKSVLKSSYAQLIAKNDLHQEGSIEVKQQLQMIGSHVAQQGTVNVGEILTIKADDISANTSSLIRSKILALEAKAKISNQGNIKAEELVAMKAPTIDLGQNSRVQAPTTDLKAKEEMSNQGSIQAKDKLAIRSDIVINNGSIAAGNAQVNANKMLWNGGKVSAQEELIINAYKSVNTWNSVIEARDYRRRCVYGWEFGSCTAQNNDLNSIVACNLGVVRSGNWSFKKDICTRNNLWNVGKTAGIMGLSYACPPVGTTLSVMSALYGLSQVGNSWAVIQAEEAAIGQSREISDLIPIYCQKKDLAISTILSAATVCRAGLGATDYYNNQLSGDLRNLVRFVIKQLIGSSNASYAQSGSATLVFDMGTCIQNISKVARDNCNENNLWRAGEIAFVMSPNKFHWLHAPFVAAKLGRITYRDWNTFFKTGEASVYARSEIQQGDNSVTWFNPDFGANSKTIKRLAPGLMSMLNVNNSSDALLNIDLSSILGVSGNSRSLLALNGGSSLFAGGYALQTGYGFNIGTLGAMNLNINAAKTYNTGAQSLLCGITGSMAAENLELDGSMCMEDHLSIEAKNNIRLGAQVHAKNIGVKGSNVSLQKESSIVGENSSVIAHTLTHDGNINVTGQSVLNAKEKVCGEGKVNAGSNIIQGKEVHIPERFQISGGESNIQGDLITHDGNISVTGQSVLNAKGKVTVRGKMYAAGTYIQGEEADLQKTSEVSGGQAEVTADIIDANGKIDLTGHLGIEARTQVTMNTKIDAGSALVNAPEILLKEGNSVKALANDDQTKPGFVIFRGDNITNYGSVEATNAKINANNKLWNGGKFSAQKELEINAYTFVSTWKSVIGAQNYKRNCFFSLEVGSRTTQHDDLNSMAAFNIGVLRSGNWSFKEDVCTWNNAFNVGIATGIAGISYACPPAGAAIGAASALYKLYQIPYKLAEITQAEAELNKMGNVEFSDRIPIYCKQKDLAVSTVSSLVTLGCAGVGVWKHFNKPAPNPVVVNVELNPGEMDVLKLRRILEKQGIQPIKNPYYPYQVLNPARRHLYEMMSKNQAAHPINPASTLLNDLKLRAIMGNNWARTIEPLHVVSTTSDFKFGEFINSLALGARSVGEDFALSAADYAKNLSVMAYDACTEDNCWRAGEVAFTLSPSEYHWLHAPFVAIKHGRIAYRDWNKFFEPLAEKIAQAQEFDKSVAWINPDFGPNLKTLKALAPSLVTVLDSRQSSDALVNFDFGSTLGVSGNSRSLCTVNGGSSLFVGGYILDTVYGFNKGNLGAMHLNINAAKTYRLGSRSSLYGITGSVSAQDIDVHGNINMVDTATLNATHQIRMQGGATTNAKVVNIIAPSLLGAQENSITSTEHTYLRVSHLDNKGTINGVVALEYTGPAEQLNSIGKMDHLQYSGTLEGNIADRLACGRGDLLHINQGGSVTVSAKDQDVHLKEQHDISHTFNAKTEGNIYLDEKIVSQGSISLHGKNVTHDSLLANNAVDIDACQNVIARSKVERQSDGVNYQDTVKQVVVRGGDSTRVHAKNGHIDYKGVKIGSGKEGTLLMAENGKVIADAVFAEKYTEEYHANKKSREGTWTKETSTTAHISDFDSEGVVVIHAGDSCELTGTKFNAQGGVIAYGRNGVHGHDAHDTCKSTTDYKKDGGRVRTTKDDHVETVTSTAKPVEFKGGVAPIITSDEQIVLSCTNDAATITLNAPEVQCSLSKNVLCSNSSNANNNLFWKSEKSDQKVDVTAGPTFQSSITTNAQKFYIEQVNGRASVIINNSNAGGEITRTLFDEIHTKQMYRKRGPTKAASAVIAMAVTFATAGIGSTAGATLATAVGCKSAVATAMITNMTSATVSSLSVLATDALMRNGGDIDATARSLAKTNTLKFLALSALTAGAMTRAGQVFNQMGLPAVQSAKTFGERIAYAAPREMAHAAIRTTCAVAVGQNFKDAAKQNLRYAVAGTIGTACASQIGDVYAQGEINPITHKLLHTAVGAAEGAIIGGASGAVAGGLGAAVAETVADLSAPAKPSIEKIKELEVALGRPFTQEEFIQHWDDQARTYMQAISSTAATSQLAAGTVALLIGQDVAIATDAAALAIDNNFFVLATYGLAAAGVAYSAYNVYSAYETEGASAALKQLGIEVTMEIAGVAASRVAGKVIYKVGQATYPTVKAAVDSVFQSNPGLGCALGSIAEKIIIGAEKINQSALGKAVHKMEAALLEQESKIAARFGFNCIGAANSEVFASTPVGRPGSILNVATKNKPEIINGVKFTGHALDRMQERGILSPSVVLDIVKNPVQTYPGNRPDTYVYIRDNLKVVANGAGDILTVIPQ